MVTHFWMCLMHVSIYQFYTELSKGVKIAAETIIEKNEWMNAFTQSKGFPIAWEKN